MLINTHHIYGSSVVATDKVAGTVRDILFDDRTWELKFLVVHSGRWLTGQSELLTPDVIGSCDWMARELSVNLTEDEVVHSPPPESHPPASLEKNWERSLVAWDVYWSGMIDESNKPAGDPHLDSVKEVTGYHVDAVDGVIGHIADFLIDDETWTIRYVVMDTRNWLPGKHVLLAPALFKAVNWEERMVRVNAAREMIKDAPVFDVTVPLTRKYEQKLVDYYGVGKYWGDVAE